TRGQSSVAAVAHPGDDSGPIRNLAGYFSPANESPVRTRRSEHGHGTKTGLSDLPPVEVPRTIHRREHPPLRRKNPTHPVKQTTQNCSRTRLPTPSNQRGRLSVTWKMRPTF